MRVPYTVFKAQAPQPSLGGGLDRPRPITPARIYGPSGDYLIDGQLDSGADDTIVPAWVGAAIGIDLTSIPEHFITLVGRPQPIRCRFLAVTLRITDGLQETYKWPSVVGFVPLPLKRALFGYAGFLQFFDADFRGARREVILLPNNAFAGQSF